MSEWLDSELYRRRTLQVAGDLGDETGSRLAAALMTMDAEGDEAIELRLTSSGGSMDAAFSLIDTIDLLGVPVRATAVGAVFGPAAFVLALCPLRRAAPSARIRLAEPTFSEQGRAQDLVAAAAAARARLDEVTRRVAAASGRTLEEIESATRTGRTFTAEEALALGLIDEIVTAPGRAARGVPTVG